MNFKNGESVVEIGDIKNILQHYVIQIAKDYYGTGKPMWELTEIEKESHFLNSFDKTVAIILYEFATGTGLSQRKFDEWNPYTNAFKNTIATYESLLNFYQAFDIFKNTCSGCAFSHSYYFSFSPDKTIEKRGLFEGLKESLIKHLSPDSKVLVTRGGMMFEMSLAAENKIKVIIKDAYTYSSLAAHLSNSFERVAGQNTIFGTTRIEMEFFIDFRSDGAQYYQNLVNDYLNR